MTLHQGAPGLSTGASFATELQTPELATRLFHPKASRLGNLAGKQVDIDVASSLLKTRLSELALALAKGRCPHCQ